MAGATFPYAWDRRTGARVGAARRGRRRRRRPTWFDVEPCYVFHPLNAYDDGDRVVLDVVRHPRMFDDRARSARTRARRRSAAGRSTSSTGKVIEERLDDRGQEFPRVDERLVGRRHRYGYALASDRRGSSTRGDRSSTTSTAGTTEDARLRRGAHAAEPVFVPAADDAAEDDGWVHDVRLRRDDRPQRPRHPRRAGLRRRARRRRCTSRSACPFGFHGNWVPDPD